MQPPPQATPYYSSFLLGLPLTARRHRTRNLEREGRSCHHYSPLPILTYLHPLTQDTQEQKKITVMPAEDETIG